MSIDNKDQFEKDSYRRHECARRCTGDAQAIIDSAEEIRNGIDGDETKDLVNKRTGKWHEIRGGELKEVK